MESGKSPARAALLGVLVFFCVGLAVAIGVIIYSKETAPPEPTPAVDEEYLARKKAEAEERAASEAGAEEARRKWREEQDMSPEFDFGDLTNLPPGPSENVDGMGPGTLARKAALIKPGWLLAKVEQLLGEPYGKCMTKKERNWRYIWENGINIPVKIEFEDDKVVRVDPSMWVEKPDYKDMHLLFDASGTCGQKN